MPSVQKSAARSASRKTASTRKAAGTRRASTARKAPSARKTTSARKAPAARKAATAARTSTPRKTAAKAAGKSSAGQAARARCEQNSHAVARIKEALEATQREMTAMRGSLEVGGKDLRKEVAKRLRDARRDVEKMNTTVRRDLQRLQKDISGAAKAKPSRPARKKAPRGRARPARRTGSRAS